jgi:threonine/homoserine/homoserine lactone efflux protein
MIDPLPLATYSFVMSITPGPNNVMLTASGANFGFRRTLPHLFGVTSGFAIQVGSVCVGLGALFQRWPGLQTVLQWAGAAYLVYMGWRLLGASMANANASARPIRFLEAAAFQFVNPKAWVMALTASALFLPAELSLAAGAAYMAGLAAAVNLPCVMVWALFGSSMRRFLMQPRRRIAFNATMAVALAATGVMMVL